MEFSQVVTFIRDGDPVRSLPVFSIDLSEWPYVKETLEQHGATIKRIGDRFTVVLPDGCVFRKRVPEVERGLLVVVFPDGWWLIWRCDGSLC